MDKKVQVVPQFISTYIDSPLGQLLAIADSQYLYLLKFTDQKDLAQSLTKLKNMHAVIITSGTNELLKRLEDEMKEYFSGKLKNFTIPVCHAGSSFQYDVWQALQTVPYGVTNSYSSIARAIKRPTAFRAAANAHGANPCLLIIPCHRTIASDGTLGGFAGGVSRKKWLIEHEAQFI